MSDPSTTHDPHDDYDDSFGVPARKPSTVVWACVCWMVFALCNVATFVMTGLQALNTAFTGLLLGELQFLVCLTLSSLAVFFGVLVVGFGIISHNVHLNRPATLERSLVWSWSVTALIVLTGVALSCWWINVLGFTRFPIYQLAYLSGYVLPALIGSILASIGRGDYQAWKNRRASRTAMANNQ